MFSGQQDVRLYGNLRKLAYWLLIWKPRMSHFNGTVNNVKGIAGEASSTYEILIF